MKTKKEYFKRKYLKYDQRRYLKQCNELCMLPEPIEHRNYIRYIGIVSAQKIYGRNK